MTRTALTLELLAILALACERHEKAVAQQPVDGGNPTETVEPELSNAQLEQELDRLEQEIKNGKRPVDGGASAEATAKESDKSAPASSTAPKTHRNKPKGASSKSQEKNSRRSGNGSS